ncbi:MAG: lysostaphin resistance A-like protein [Alphaproteobacteria bacterium]
MSETAPDPETGPRPMPPIQRLVALFLPQVVFLVVAFVLGALIGAPPFARFAVTPDALLHGLAGALGLVGIMTAFQAMAPKLAQEASATSIEMMRRANVTLTWPLILTMSAAAGLCEEALFRGVLQTWSDGILPLWAAILLPALLFSVLHFYSVLYVLIVFPIALYLGGLFAITDNLFIVIIAHALYDVFGLWNVRRAMAAEGA